MLANGSQPEEWPEFDHLVTPAEACAELDKYHIDAGRLAVCMGNPDLSEATRGTAARLLTHTIGELGKSGDTGKGIDNQTALDRLHAMTRVCMREIQRHGNN